MSESHGSRTLSVPHLDIQEIQWEYALVLETQILLSNVERTLKTYMRSCKRHYSLHFPELRNIIRQPLIFFKVIKRVGKRGNFSRVYYSDLLSPFLRYEVRKAAISSRGMDFPDDIAAGIQRMCRHIVAMWKDRQYLRKFMRRIMKAVAPEFTASMGWELGAKAIHAAYLMHLSRKRLAGRANAARSNERNALQDIENLILEYAGASSNSPSAQHADESQSSDSEIQSD